MAMKLAQTMVAEALLIFGPLAFAQTCPKVAYTTQAATLRSLVTSVNCLAATSESSKAESSKSGMASTTTPPAPGMSVDRFAIVGPQHTRSYRHLVFAVLAVPTGNVTKTVVVTPDTQESSISATGGSECRIKINADGSVDGQCNLTGGTMYVVYRN
jgi:hypothetical protein